MTNKDDIWLGKLKPKAHKVTKPIGVNLKVNVNLPITQLFNAVSEVLEQHYDECGTCALEGASHGCSTGKAIDELYREVSKKKAQHQANMAANRKKKLVEKIAGKEIKKSIDPDTFAAIFAPLYPTAE
jgi:hypothetical protein